MSQHDISGVRLWMALECRPQGMMLKRSWQEKNKILAELYELEGYQLYSKILKKIVIQDLNVWKEEIFVSLFLLHNTQKNRENWFTHWYLSSNNTKTSLVKDTLWHIMGRRCWLMKSEVFLISEEWLITLLAFPHTFILTAHHTCLRLCVRHLECGDKRIYFLPPRCPHISD